MDKLNRLVFIILCSTVIYLLVTPKLCLKK